MSDCASDYDCPAENAECFVDKCLCTPGFYFSLSRHTCSAACNEADLQGVYLEYPGYFIQSHNMALYFRDTTEQCLAECTGVTNCRTVDPAYDGSRHCVADHKQCL
nr:hypothetical protein BaRGS_004845 [Batillaria attramentaria]